VALVSPGYVRYSIHPTGLFVRVTEGLSNHKVREVRKRVWEGKGEGKEEECGGEHAVGIDGSRGKAPNYYYYNVVRDPMLGGLVQKQQCLFHYESSGGWRKDEATMGFSLIEVMLWVPFSALMLLDGWQKGHPSDKTPLVSKRSFPEPVEKEKCGERKLRGCACPKFTCKMAIKMAVVNNKFLMVVIG